MALIGLTRRRSAKRSGSQVGDFVLLSGVHADNVVTDLLGPGAKGFEDDDVVEEDDDADYADDPISQIDMKASADPLADTLRAD